MTLNSHLTRLQCRRLLHHLEANRDFRRGSEACSHAAVFRLRQLNSLFDRAFAEVTSLQDVVQLDAVKTAWKIAPAFATHFDAVIGHMFPFLPQNLDYIGSHATPDGNEKQLDRGCRRAPLTICLHH